MERSNIDLRSLPLHDLLSAPLKAAMDAQQQASLGLISFIIDAGFIGDEKERQSVRMVEFNYTRAGRDANGKQTTVDTRLRIPLLAMISLPHLEIEKLNVNVLLGLQSVEENESSPKLNIPPVLRKKYSFLQGHSNLIVSPTSRTSMKETTKTTRPYDLEITMTATTIEPSDGIERMMTSLIGMMSEETK
jgi:hypothetical protein